MPNKMTFNKHALDSLKTKDGKRVMVFDNKTRGLAMRVSPTGKKTFILYRKIAGKREFITLGDYPDLDIEHARGKAEELNASIAVGRNPINDRLKTKAELTFNEFFDKYLELYAKHHKITWNEDRKKHEKYLTKWHNVKLSHITHEMVTTLHTQLGDLNGKYLANRVLALVSTVFNRATKLGYCNHNPALGVEKFSEKSRDRFLQEDELPRLLQTLSMETNTDLRDYVLLSLLTGARKNNILSMSWDQIDFYHKIWHIPLTKNGTSQNIPLTEYAIAILNSRIATKERGKFIFPSSKSAGGHFIEPKKGWASLLKKAGIVNLRRHDLRRTLGSWEAKTGASMLIIGKTLNHLSHQSTQVYARLDLDPVRAAMEKAHAAMLLINEEL